MGNTNIEMHRKHLSPYVIMQKFFDNEEGQKLYMTRNK